MNLFDAEQSALLLTVSDENGNEGGAVELLKEIACAIALRFDENRCAFFGELLNHELIEILPTSEDETLTFKVTDNGRMVADLL